MKKNIFRFFMLLIFTSIAFVFAGCEDEEVTEVLAGPTNTWCKMQVNYKASDDATSDETHLYAYFYYTDTEKTISGKQLPAGLNLVLTATDSDTVFGVLEANLYVLKTFPKDADTEVSENSSDTDVIKVNGSRAKWAAIYWAKDELRKPENKSSNPPSQFANGTDVSIESLQNFSLKRLLAKYLLSVLDS